MALTVILMGKQANFALTQNEITEGSIKSAFLLASDTVINLSYEVNGYRTWCTTRKVPEPTFILPEDWSGLTFDVNSDKMPSRPATPMDGASNERSHSPYYPKAFLKWIFFIYDEMGKAATICIHPRFFVTFRHGTHLQFKLGDCVKIYHVEQEMDEQDGTEVTVVNINDDLDFVLLKSQSEVVERGPPIVQARESESFTLAGFGNDIGTLSFLPGIIHSTKDYYFDGDRFNMGPFILGTSRSSRGDSGAGIWGANGLIGMNSGCTTMPLQFHHLAISEAVTFSAKNIISPSVRFKEAYTKELRKERKEGKLESPPQKKPYLMAEFEGLGTGIATIHALYLSFGHFAALVCIFIGFLYPAYESISVYQRLIRPFHQKHHSNIDSALKNPATMPVKLTTSTSSLSRLILLSFSNFSL